MRFVLDTEMAFERICNKSPFFRFETAATFVTLVQEAEGRVDMGLFPLHPELQTMHFFYMSDGGFHRLVNTDAAVLI